MSNKRWIVQSYKRRSGPKRQSLSRQPSCGGRKGRWAAPASYYCGSELQVSAFWLSRNCPARLGEGGRDKLDPNGPLRPTLRMGAWEVRAEKRGACLKPRIPITPLRKGEQVLGTQYSLGTGPPSLVEERMGVGGCRTELSATPKSFTGRGSPGNLQRYQRTPQRGFSYQSWVGAGF